MSEIDDPTPRTDPGRALGNAFDLIARKRDGRKPPTACCPRDGEPLIFTMELPGAEFHCVVCGNWLGFLAPTPKEQTPELDARYDHLKALFDAGQRGPIDA